ncbi:hypothetical protein O6H91_03G020200 [Diphasiastrum complanatum]|uniref:Uncharacterized protein n=7 Tax=Diphasiastrum complanatum TaxID=34168 RepID=A0ACC2E4D3_DIPCM|nr:hypothetical protein O6H91_03G020200 [Diphasiastrum complanatum]KAJ7561241.1 hypothetical protein O6H91_03G020200 [Diphasiastrum complanatum]KAJ7561244.1 hypothetical protein O6H91_03G020200 [Diphasiastrum complanatum]KAJ7561246.1 hypothetical protein O6H91_03G020200 [Diphasiastrum complanatum]KAJ7561248.1 hypothetical protein O6H91_03G020200 [Diphasiastrum complanatum]
MAPRIGGELPFRLSLTGYSGHLRVEPLPPVTREAPVGFFPDLILPPALPADTPDSLLRKIEDEYITPCLDDEVHDVANCGKTWDFEWFGSSVPYLEPSVPQTTLVPVWIPPHRRSKQKKEKFVGSIEATNITDANTMWIPDFEEVEAPHSTEGAHNSSSLLRRPGPPEDFVRGSTSNQPFLPGGSDLSHKAEKYIPEGALNGEWLTEILQGGPLETVPPGFKRGLDLGAPEDDLGSLSFDDLFHKAWLQSLSEEESTEADDLSKGLGEIRDEIGVIEESQANEEATMLEEILSKTTVEIMASQVHQAKEEDQANVKAWAVKGGGERVAEQFFELIPDLAMSFPFELDLFQKEAIFHLERNESVFVAAHTSAGKTVVAEYAFALAAKHCTRAVYTSPIKTISNQKYRDFSEKFDVGLLTGDVSIRPDASCLIMTTEILRSMLYKGADIIRDIEWVIFDEVHYVNDVDRGVVWEEVIIMLPDHVNMVLLSATVPNIYEFVDWIGRTKQKKIYVTETSQRPVPLEHCLYYFGELFKICENEKFLPEGVKAAKDAYLLKTALKKGPSPSRGGSSAQGHGASSQGRGRGGAAQTHDMSNQGRGRGGKRSVPQGSKGSGGKSLQAFDSSGQHGGGAWRSETSQWYSLVQNLSKKGLLPVVVFCFSKNRCDRSADSLTAADLTSSSEKSEIRVFCDKAFSRLKGSDRKLPQVLRVQELLRRGIGVHHAGLLPIVKEVVEMLFCRGMIKVLFSTETFAMGVNAPARTVAFHSLRKHDGKTFREILPGEYTQMAGRAGRRGLDKVGTVIIMCWEDIPEEGDLRRLLTGRPTKLESQFRLTYCMILSLLRVEELKVEDLLKRSFAEFHAQRALPEQQQQLQKREGELIKLTSTIECIFGEPTIEEYYELARESEQLGKEIQDTIMQSRAAQQSLTPGRIVIVHSPKIPVPSLGVVLKAPTGSKSTIVLTLYRGVIPTVSEALLDSKSGANKQPSDGGYFISRKGSRGLDDEYTVFGGSSRKGSGIVRVSLPYYGTAGGTGYVAIEVGSKDFVSICKEKIRVDPVRLLEDVSVAAYSMTMQQLLQLELQYPNEDPPALDLVKDLKINDLDVVEKYRKRQLLLEKMAKNQCHRCPKLQEHYALIKNQQTLMERVKQLKFELSDAALQQMPDFQQRIEVLQDVGCIDSELIVQLKGRVACEINSGDELIATECLFENQLSDLDAAEAVALLSALVFQQKDASEPLLTKRLAEAKERLVKAAIRLGEIQAHHGLQINPEDYARDALKFGLMEVVYEWAKGTPFAEICELTDVPEGSIVRTIVRLDETCREFKNAARIIGDSSLFKKMEEASNAIKHDIVFAASLYITGLPSIENSQTSH